MCIIDDTLFHECILFIGFRGKEERRSAMSKKSFEWLLSLVCIFHNKLQRF